MDEDKDSKMLSEEERGLWKQATSGVERLKKDKKQSVEVEKPSTTTQKSRSVELKSDGVYQEYFGSEFKNDPLCSEERINLGTPEKDKAGKDLDRRTDERLRKGRLPIDATLDLHGYSKVRAKSLLSTFLQKSYQDGKRCILVITGKGRLSAPGVIRQALPEFLEEPPLSSIVLKAYQARPQHGGSGAVYIYLRKNKDKP